MRYVILMRHAKPQLGMFLDDSIRPISNEGKDVERAMALFLKEAGYPIDTIWHSPYLRTTETAKIIADVFGIQAKRESLLSPFVSEELIAAKIAESQQNIAIVGHSPSLQRLLYLLTQGKCAPVDIKTSSAIIIQEAKNIYKAIYVHPETFTKIDLL